MNQPAQNISGARIHIQPEADWSTIHDCFRDADTATLFQAWRETPNERFRPARVAVAHDDSTAWIFAQLDDDDPYNPADTFNEMAYLRGDVFEIFLRPEGQEAYFEFHVTPNNVLMQLRIPNPGALKQAGGSGLPADWFVTHPRIFHRAGLASDGTAWRVLAGIPFAMVNEISPISDRPDWLYSFSRYDYTQGVKDPVLSSTSPHAVVNFHRQEEWGRIVFR